MSGYLFSMKADTPLTPSEAARHLEREHGIQRTGDAIKAAARRGDITAMVTPSGRHLFQAAALSQYADQVKARGR